MSDYNSGLPVRTQNNGDVAAKIVDGTTTSQALAIDASGRITTKMDDGAGNAITSQANGVQRALDVGIDVAGVQIDPRQIRALTSADIVTVAAITAALPAGTNLLGSVNQGTSPWITKDVADGSASGGTAGTFSLLMGGIYNSTLPTLTTGQQASLQLDTSGRLLVDLTAALPSGTNTIGSVKLTDGTNTVAVAPASTAATSTQAAEVVALSPNSPLPAGTNAIGSVLANLQVASAAVSNTNPVPVSITTSAPGTAVQDYHTSVALAVGASVTFTYTVAASHTFSLQRLYSSASGKIKSVAAIGASTIFTSFNSTANPNIDIPVQATPTVAAAGTVTITVTNLDLLAMDVYATIEGNQN